MENMMNVIFNWLGWQAGRRTICTFIQAFSNVEYAGNRNIMCAGFSALTPSSLERGNQFRFYVFSRIVCEMTHENTKKEDHSTTHSCVLICHFYVCVRASVCLCKHVRVRRKRPTQIKLHL